MSVFSSLLNQEFTTTRPSRVSDGQGGWTVSYTTVGVVRGRLRPASAEERSVAAQEQRRISHVLYVAAGEDIARGDLVTGDSVTVEVLGVREPSRAGQHLELDCQETQIE